MSQDNLIKLKCATCKRINYFTTKSKEFMKGKGMEMVKYCKWERKRTAHKEAKK